MLFDPGAPAPSDPHAGVPLTFFSPGIGHLLARTGWGTDATWFDYTPRWITIDHQTADGNQVEVYRRGDWLTQTRVGYRLPLDESDDHNTLAPPYHVPA